MAISWSSRSAIARLRPVWGDEGAGTVWLALGIAATFVFGLFLQLLGLRTLSDGAYATFVFGLGLGNVANAVAAAVQPVVAARAAADDGTFLPASPRALVAGAVLLCLAGVALLGPSVGPVTAFLAVAQIPLHAAVAVGLGRLQAARAFARLSGCLVVWSVVRIAVVVPFVLTGRASAEVFVLALPAALAAELALLAGLGAFRGVAWRTAPDGGALRGSYGLWALFAWLLNADAVYALLFLDPANADRYATALTLGRQPIYAVAPLAMVLLPVTQAGGRGGQRERLRAILGVAALVFAGSFVVLGIRPDLVLGLLTGNAAATSAALVRGYTAVGSLAAAATLLMTFTFALGGAPRTWLLIALTAGSLAAAALVATPGQLLLVQGLAVALLTLLCLAAGVKVTRRAPSLGSSARA
jgi:hypothetical protein